ncbi:MAG: phosphatase PAP2 family protein [Mariprofundaceae bacterium]|nr:phosphatase PAP2 family protein [Mariprofundaceae bacterium]
MNMNMFIDNLYWLHYFNHIIGESADLFYNALFLSNRLAWILYALALCSMWYAGTPGLLPERPKGLLRHHARTITLMICCAMPVLFIISKAIQKFVESNRPMMQENLLQIPLPPKIWHRVVDSFHMQGSFPSDHAVVFFLLATSLFSLNRWWGVIGLVLATFFSLLRVALGFHWPMDVLVGAIMGIVAGLVVIILSRWMVDGVFMRLSRKKINTWVFAVLVYLFLYDCSYKFSHIMRLLGHD